MALIGAARAFNIDLQPYLSPYGVEIYNKLKNASIINVLGQYSGLTWKQMAKPEYASPETVPVYVSAVNKLIMGTGGTPTVPMLIGQGANGELEGTPGTGKGGKGDGVMIAGECARWLVVLRQGQEGPVQRVRRPQPHPGRSRLARSGSRLDQGPSHGPRPDLQARSAELLEHRSGNSLAPIPTS